MKAMCFAKDCEGDWYLIPFYLYNYFHFDSEEFSRTGDYELMDSWQRYRISSPNGMCFYV